MAVANFEDLFVYELSGMHDEEREVAVLIADMIDQIRDDHLCQAMRLEHRESQQRLKDMDLCFHSIGSRPRQVAAVVVEGMHADYQRFLSLEPSDLAVNMYTFGAALKLSHFAVAGYTALVDKTVMARKAACARALQGNLLRCMESVGRLHRISHEMSQRIMAPA